MRALRARVPQWPAVIAVIYASTGTRGRTWGRLVEIGQERKKGVRRKCRPINGWIGAIEVEFCCARSCVRACMRVLRAHSRVPTSTWRKPVERRGGSLTSLLAHTSKSRRRVISAGASRRVNRFKYRGERSERGVSTTMEARPSFEPPATFTILLLALALAIFMRRRTIFSTALRVDFNGDHLIPERTIFYHLTH